MVDLSIVFCDSLPVYQRVISMGLQLLDGDVSPRKIRFFRISSSAFCSKQNLFSLRLGLISNWVSKKRGVLKMAGFNTQNGRRGWFGVALWLRKAPYDPWIVDIHGIPWISFEKAERSEQSCSDLRVQCLLSTSSSTVPYHADFHHWARLRYHGCQGLMFFWWRLGQNDPQIQVAVEVAVEVGWGCLRLRLMLRLRLLEVGWGWLKLVHVG